MDSLDRVKSNDDSSSMNLHPDGRSELKIGEAGSTNLVVSYPKGSLICEEGAPASGVFILERGRVKESLSCSDGKKIIVRIAGPGQIVGLTSILASKTFDATVETLEPTRAKFIPRRDFLQELEISEKLANSVARQLGQNCKDAYRNLRRHGFSVNIAQRLATLILEWSEQTSAQQQNGDARLTVTLTQEEIGQLVGTTRETVSRMLAGFRQKGWIVVKGVIWSIRNRNALLRMSQVGDAQTA